jgi:preprotein translocase subunit YajC
MITGILVDLAHCLVIAIVAFALLIWRQKRKEEKENEAERKELLRRFHE